MNIGLAARERAGHSEAARRHWRAFVLLGVAATLATSYLVSDMAIATRLLMGGGGSFTAPPTPFPTSWSPTRFAGNPIIAVGGGEPDEQYDPAPFQIGSDVYTLVKGAARIYLYKSPDFDGTFVGQNGGSAVINIGSAGQWDDTHALEPAALYEDSTIRAWYKGSGDGGTTWGWGYATAPGGTPTVFTKSASNPILTAAAINTQMGGAGVSDTAPFDVIRDGSTYHFYGYVAYNSIYKLVHMTGTNWDSPNVATLTVLLDPGVSTTIAGTGCVFRVIPVVGNPRYGMFYTWGPLTGAGRTIRVGHSTNLVTWNFSDTTDIISNTGSGWEKDWAYTPRLLRENDGLTPVLNGSQWVLYYSGNNQAASDSQTGLIYLAPS